MKIVTHRATDAERLQAFRNSYEAWGRDLTPEAFLERRQNSMTIQRADWWVLTVDGEVASALGLQNLKFSCNNTLVPGFGFGSVHTLSKWRKRGFAERLCLEAMQDATNAGARVGLLFSDVPTQYYGKMGFVPCSSDKHNCMDPGAIADSGPQLRLQSIEPLKELDLLTRAYATEFAKDKLWVWRDRPYSRYVIERDSEDYFSIHDGGESLGYVRVFIGKEVVFPVEIALLDPTNEALRSKVFRTLAAMAQKAETPRFSCWITPTPTLKHFFETTRRPKSITMVWTHPNLNIEALSLETEFRVSPADYF